MADILEESLRLRILIVKLIKRLTVALLKNKKNFSEDYFVGRQMLGDPVEKDPSTKILYTILTDLCGAKFDTFSLDSLKDIMV